MVGYFSFMDCTMNCIYFSRSNQSNARIFCNFYQLLQNLQFAMMLSNIFLQLLQNPKSKPAKVFHLFYSIRQDCIRKQLYKLSVQEMCFSNLKFYLGFKFITSRPRCLVKIAVRKQTTMSRINIVSAILSRITNPQISGQTYFPPISR